MPASIFGDRFYGLREAAWHQLGTVSEDEQGALAALEAIGGSPVYTLEPVTATVNGTTITLPERSIVRHPTDDDPEYVGLGFVGPDYQQVTPGDVCSVWDEFVAQPVETLAFLGRGDQFFITSKLPAIDVAGDEVEMYLGATAPMRAGLAATTEIWPLRVVCANTLRIAQTNARDRYRVVHDETARERMGAWLADMYGRAEAEVSLLREAFDVLAAHQVSADDEQRIVDAAYRIPARPRPDAPDEVLDERMRHWQASVERRGARKQAALDLFHGAGTGMDTLAANGTAWGLYNAVVEAEDYRRGWNRDGQEAAIVAEGAMFGERAKTKMRAYDAAMAVSAAN